MCFSNPKTSYNAVSTCAYTAGFMACFSYSNIMARGHYKCNWLICGMHHRVAPQPLTAAGVEDRTGEC